MIGKLYWGFLLSFTISCYTSLFAVEQEISKKHEPAISDNNSVELKENNSPESVSPAEPEKVSQNPVETETSSSSPSGQQEKEETFTQTTEDDTLLKPQEFTQYELKETSAVYQINGNLIAEFAKRLNVSGSLNSTIKYSLRPAENAKNEWHLTIKVSDGDKSIITYFVKMDLLANVIEEKGIFTEYIDGAPTLFQKIKGEDSTQTVKERVEHLTIATEKQPVFGESKVIRVQKDSGDFSELMVDPHDKITTLAQIVVWIGTIKDIPEQGIALRWTADGKPFPMILREARNEGKRLLQLYRDDPTLSEEQKNTPVVQFILKQNKLEFTYPEKIILIINRAEIEIVKQTEGK